ncbi:DUF4398 domain-containing protein, partial [Candidatus Micrarchaeota archaeon]|nr:DUF4398 domain-containing protein [Candidatus Micrarchaeota archaeon]
LVSGDGPKTVYFKCADNESNWSADVSDSIELNTTVPDTIAPSASNKLPSGTISNRRPTISAVLTDTGGSGINNATILLRLDGAVVSHTYSSGTVSYTPASDLNSSIHSANLSVSDNAGNPYSVTWSFTISSQGVGFDDFGPANNSYTADKTPDVSVILVDTGSGINASSLKMTVDTNNASASYSTSSKNYSYSSSTLSDGNHTAEVWVRDNSGKESYAKWIFTVDTTKPTISLFVPSEDAVVTQAPHISAKIEDSGAGVDEHKIYMDLNNVDITASVQYDTGTDTATFSPTVTLSAGTYKVEMWATDKMGNENNVDWSFTIASSAPVIATLRPQNGTTTTEAKPEISAIITDAGTSGINTNSIRVFFDGVEVTARATYNAGSGKVSYVPTDNLEDGRHTAEVRAKDNNNQQTMANWSFSVDASAPLSPANFSAVQDENGTRLSWGASPSNDTESYVIYGALSSFTSIAGKAAIATLGAENRSYFHDITTRYYYALVAEDKNGNQGAPVFAGTCSVYSATAGWTDYECCLDSQCLEGYYCDASRHQCKRSATDGKTEAEAAIRESQDIIDAVKEAGKNTSEAEDFIGDAQNALNAGNYAQAEHFASLAADAARSAPLIAEETGEESDKKALPCCPSAFILVVLCFAAMMRK